MRDQYDDLVHQALRHQFAADIGRLVKSVAYAFDRLTARLYAAPWAEQARPKDGCTVI